MTSDGPPRNPGRAWSSQRFAEVLLVLLVFCLQGATPVPEVNEPYYLGKAIHFWRPDWAGGDLFLNTADTHKVFYFSFGWLALVLSPVALAWVGRLITWALLAWSWQRLSWTLVPRRWLAVATAALFVAGLHWGHMAGEWVVGGVEAKGFAFVLVFLGLESLLTDRWNRVWILLGAASAFHVLVGGWATIAAGVAWLAAGRERPALRSMAPGLLAGLLLALPGLLPSLLLSRGADAETVGQANWIYVFGRLYHHLAPSYFPALFVGRFLGLASLFFVLDACLPGDSRRRRLRWFVAGALAIAAVGAAINLLVADEFQAAALLKYYWFRLSDVAVPLGLALVGGQVVHRAASERAAALRPAGQWAMAAAAVTLLGLAASHVAYCAWQRTQPMVPRADRGTPDEFWAWRWACQWVADSDIPPQARFLTPVRTCTFKWYAHRGEVVNWKEIPQDAQSMVAWWHTIHEIYGPDDGPTDRFCSLAAMDDARLVELGRKYGAQYAIMERRAAGAVRRRSLAQVYRNDHFVIYRLGIAEPGGGTRGP